MPINSFAPGTSLFLNVGNVSSHATIPTGGSILLVSNLSQGPVFVAIGTSASLAVTTTNGMPVLPQQQVAITTGANTTLAAVGLGGSSGLMLTAGN